MPILCPAPAAQIAQACVDTSPSEPMQPPKRLRPYHLIDDKVFQVFAAHLPAARSLMEALDEMTVRDAPWEQPVAGWPDERALSKYTRIEADPAMGRGLHGVVLPDGVLLLSTPAARDALAWVGVSVTQNVDRVLLLCPSTMEAAHAPPLMRNETVLSRNGAVEAHTECRLTVRLKNKESALIQRDHTVTLQRKGKGHVRDVKVLQAPVLRAHRQTCPVEVKEVLSLLPTGHGGRLAVMAPEINDEAAIMVAAHQMASWIGSRAPMSAPLSDEKLDDLLLEVCGKIRTGCRADLFRHADQLATLRYFAHDWRDQVERERLRERRREHRLQRSDQASPGSDIASSR